LRTDFGKAQAVVGASEDVEDGFGDRSGPSLTAAGPFRDDRRYGFSAFAAERGIEQQLKAFVGDRKRL